MARRTFRFDAFQDKDGNVYAPDREEATQLVADLIGSVFQLGGLFSFASHREEVAPGQYETTAILVTHDSHSPATKLPKAGQDEPAEPPAEDEAESAPV